MKGKLLNIKVYTDGACSGNPGPGGYAALLLIKSDKKRKKVVLRGGERHCTNNRMELLAVVEALKFINKNLNNYKLQIEVYSDSAYVVNSINYGALLKWSKNGWKTSQRKDVASRDLWEKLDKLDNLLSPSFILIKGHGQNKLGPNKFNNYVDKIAVEERNKYKTMLAGL